MAAGHLDMVRLLVERGAHLHLRDTLYDATPLGWAEYLDQPAIAAFLLSVAPVAEAPPGARRWRVRDGRV